MYGLSTDPYDLHSELYGGAARNSSARSGSYGYQPEGFLEWQPSPAAPSPSSGELPPKCVHLVSLQARRDTSAHHRG